MVDVFLNGVKLDNATEFTASNGSTVVLTAAAIVNDVVEVYKYGGQFIANNTLRQTTAFTATAGQTTFTVSYSVGFVDVFYNGAKLAAAEFTATNGTSIVLGTACVVNDIVEVVAYNYTVGAFTGVGGSGTTNYIPKWTASGTLGNSLIFDNGTGIGIGNISPIFPLHISASYSKTTTTGTAQMFISTNEATASNPFGLRFQVFGGANLAARYATLQTTDYNSADGGSIILQPGGGIVGIGTTSPSGVFELVANNVDTNIVNFSTTAATNRILVLARNTNSGAQIDFRAHGGTYSETILGVSMTNAVGLIGAPASGAAMAVGPTVNSPLVFGTNNAERMRITGAGNVGIGTNNPSSAAGLAFVLNSGASQGRICIKTSSTGDASGDGLQIGVSGTSAFIEQRENDDLTFATNASERFRITSTGLFLINKTVATGYNFELNGSALFDKSDGAYAAYCHSGNLVGYVGIANQVVAGGSSGNMGINATNHLVFSTGSGAPERARINIAGKFCVGTSDGIGQITNYVTGSTITSGNVTFDSQAKGYEVYNANSAITDNLVGYWFSTGPHKTGIASGRTNASSGWEVDLRFFVHPIDTTGLNNTYERMRLYGGGNLTINGSLTQNGSLSDLTLKENIVKISNPLDKISKINGYTFTWKENAPARQHISNIIEDAGLIAQEVEQIIPEIVRPNDDGTKALNYNGVVGLLVEVVKEQQAQIEELKNLINGTK
jgi:hypothetical protein